MVTAIAVLSHPILRWGARQYRNGLRHLAAPRQSILSAWPGDTPRLIYFQRPGPSRTNFYARCASIFMCATEKKRSQ